MKKVRGWRLEAGGLRINFVFFIFFLTSILHPPSSIFSEGPINIDQLGDREKKLLMDEHYNKGLEAYSRKDYANAIRHWSDVLKIDPSQQSAKELLLKARSALAADGRKKEAEANEAIQKGSYAQARDLMRMLAANDPTNARYAEILGRLEEVAAFYPEAKGPEATVQLIKTAMKYYVGRQENPRLAIAALRYAKQKDPKQEAAGELLNLVEARFQAEAQAEVTVEGLNVVEQKLEAALNYIYEGKYSQAIRECNEALILEPNQLVALKRMGSAYFALKNKAKAHEVWKKAQQLYPSDKELKSFLAQK